MKKIVQHSFLGGQLDWEMMGRQDVDKYRSGATLLKNVTLHKRGAVFKRPGTDESSVMLTITNDHYRLIPFISTTSRGWAILFTDNAIKAVSFAGAKTVTVPSGFSYYSGDELKELDYCQCGDVVYIAHRNHPPCMIEHRITTSGNTETHNFALSVVDMNKQAQGKPSIATATVSKTGISSKGPSYTEEYKVTAVWDGVETFPSDAYSNSNCQDYDPTYAEVQSWNSIASAYPDWAAANKVYPKTYIAPCKSYTGTAYTLPWTESQKITLKINVPTIGVNRPEEIRIYRKTGSFFGLVGVVDTKSDKWKAPSNKNSMSLSFDRIKYNGTSNKGNAINKTTYEFGRFGLGGDGFRIPASGGGASATVTITLNSEANKATVNIKVGHVSYVESYVTDPYQTYDPDRVYNSGDVCKYNTTKYYCLYDGTTGTWDSTLWKSTSVSKLLQRVYTYNPCGAGSFTVRLGSGDSTTVNVESAAQASSKTIIQSPAETTANFRTRAESEGTAWTNAIEDADEVSVEVRSTTASQTITITPNASPFIVNNITTSASAKENSTSTVEWQDKFYTPDVSVTPPTETNVMNAEGDYPGCVCLSQQRLIWASTKNDPSRIFMSEIGAFYTYAPHDVMVPDDPIDFQVSETQFPRVSHMAELRKLVLFNAAAEWIVDSASSNSGITFETIRATRHSCIGSDTSLKPIVCNNVLLFAERTGQAVRQYGYDLQDDGFGGTDISIFAQSIFNEKKIVAWAFQQFPNSTCWCVLSDGTLASLTFNREQNCIAWATHELGCRDGGKVEALDIVSTGALIGNYATTPDTTEILLLVRRTYAGNAEYTIERMRPEPRDEKDLSKNFLSMDAMKIIRGSSSRREGTTLVDVQRMQVVQSTSENLQYAEGYPFDMRITTAYPVIEDAVGMAQMDVKYINQVNIRQMRSLGAFVKNASQTDQNSTVIPQPSININVPYVGSPDVTIPPIDSRVIMKAENTRDGRLTIFSKSPMPFGMTMIETDLETEEDGR